MTLKAAIVGAGIGGLTCAQALKRIGVQVTVFDRAKEFSPFAGAGFTLQPNGLTVLKQVGFSDEELKRLVNPYHSWALIDNEGKVEKLLQGVFAPYQQQLGFPIGSALRAELVEMLASRLSDQE